MRGSRRRIPRSSNWLSMSASSDASKERSSIGSRKASSQCCFDPGCEWTNREYCTFVFFRATAARRSLFGLIIVVRNHMLCFFDVAHTISFLRASNLPLETSSTAMFKLISLQPAFLSIRCFTCPRPWSNTLNPETTFLAKNSNHAKQAVTGTRSSVSSIDMVRSRAASFSLLRVTAVASSSENLLRIASCQDTTTQSETWIRNLQCVLRRVRKLHVRRSVSFSNARRRQSKPAHAKLWHCVFPIAVEYLVTEEASRGGFVCMSSRVLTSSKGLPRRAIATC